MSASEVRLNPCSCTSFAAVSTSLVRLSLGTCAVMTSFLNQLVGFINGRFLRGHLTQNLEKDPECARALRAKFAMDDGAHALSLCMELDKESAVRVRRLAQVVERVGHRSHERPFSLSIFIFMVIFRRARGARARRRGFLVQVG